MDRTVLVRYARDLSRLRPLASHPGKRTLLRAFASNMELHPSRFLCCR